MEQPQRTKWAGRAVGQYEYTPYGRRTVFKKAGSNDESTSAPLYESQRVVASGEPQPYGLCALGHQGLFLDTEFGLYDNRRRVLSPRLGRFLQRDPVGYVDGMGLYEYLRGSPTCYSDPAGTMLTKEQWEEKKRDAGPKRSTSPQRALGDKLPRWEAAGAWPPD